MITLKNINKSFGENKILKNLNLEIEEGQFIVIYGQSGGGKSTLLNIIGLIDDDFDGELTIMGKNNPKLNSKEMQDILRHHVSYLFQNYGLVDNETVFQNFNFLFDRKCSKSQRKIRSIEALEKMGLDESYLNRKIFTLSGGEQQRIALAKVLIKDSTILICDEPTGSLDEENKIKIIEILKEMSEKTIIIVSHDPELFDYADVVYSLEHKQLKQLKSKSVKQD
ncbi:ABC transporter ATP-binding protein [Mollicutes bacterium LVI A0039]|nr:ABC transporter ATP-binding protein [Mollicutes bacterium LVI A0039]